MTFLPPVIDLRSMTDLPEIPSSSHRCAGGRSPHYYSRYRTPGDIYRRRRPNEFSGPLWPPAAVCEHLELEKDAITSRSRRSPVALGRGLIGYLAVNELGISGTEVARHLRVDRSTISRAAMRIEKNRYLKESALAVLSRLQP